MPNIDSSDESDVSQSHDLNETLEIVSHELRSPLTSVRGFASTLVKRWDLFDDVQRRNMARQILRDSDRLFRVVNELFELSRIESGRLELTKTEIDVAYVAAELAGQIATEQCPISVLGLAAPVSADLGKIQQVITNLLENACKYAPSGGVGVRISDLSGSVRVAVSDEGDALTQLEVPFLFEKFVRRNADPSGSGLGLYISRKLIEAHGGVLDAVVEPGKGTTFFFEIPN